ncbi:hypothetical protein J6590_073406 [Homalodisca vitripennis]|nr:hypothetical protein J6590_073406 [Homalodisca vitripennis]
MTQTARSAHSYATKEVLKTEIHNAIQFQIGSLSNQIASFEPRLANDDAKTKALEESKEAEIHRLSLAARLPRRALTEMITRCSRRKTEQES